MSGAHIEDMLSLSPMQKGILFHSLYAPDSGVYFQQLHCVLHGKLNLQAFEQAWQQSLNRHSILRTSFFWEDLEEPVQVVNRQVTLPIETEDWSELSASAQQSRLHAFLDADRRRGFELSRAPLLRLALLRLDADRHRLIWSHHHLLLDGWSISLLLKEVFILYEALCRNESAQLAQPRPYRDYISWLQGQPLAEAERFWREKLRGFSSPTPLVIGHSAAARAGGQGEGEQGEYLEQRARLSVEETAELSAMARRHQLTLSTIVQGAWALLLSRYSGQAEVVFGATVAGRPAQLRGVEQMVGLFINTLAVRVEMGRGEEKVSEWLGRMQREAVEMRQYEHSPLVEVQGWSEVPRGTPLFESLLVFDNYPVRNSLQVKTGRSEIPEIRDVASFKQTNYPLTLTVAPGEELRLLLSYEQERFDEESISRMLTHFHHLLTAIAADPQRLVRDLPLLPDSERQQLLVEFNDTRTDFPQGLCLHQLFEEQVARTPESVALVFEDQALSYQELNARANQLAHRLRKLGVQAESRVGILLERSIEMVVSLLAVLKAGGAYVPLDPEYPGERVRFMLEDAEVCVLVTQEKLRQLLPGYEGQVLCLEAAQAEIALESEENVASGVAPENLAYVIYTSGSTGIPKGVAIAHRSIVNFLLSMCRTPGLSASDRLAAVTTLSFDIAALELFLPLTVGGRVEVLSREIASDGHLLAARLAAGAASVLQATPATWRLLLSSGWSGSPQLKALCGGERLAEELAAEMIASTGEVWNMYGPTETTVWSSVSQVKAGQVSLGKPIANTQVHVLGREMELVPVGVSGELYIGGEGVARGYLGRAELTADRFVPDPYGTQRGARLYRTGDVVRRQADGTLLYLGRADQQVKVRGYRIELGEIEAVLREQAGVRECVVVAAPHSSGSPRLVAYVVGEDGSLTGEVGRWREQLSQQLPQYMVPSAWVMLEQLPLTPNGKIDRGGLPAAGESSRGGVEGWERARRPTEELLAGIWAEVLGVREVGLHDNFFELGGHSLLATQIISRVRKAFNVEVPLRRLLDAPDIGGFAIAIEEARGADQSVAAPPIVPVSREQVLPLSFAQQRLWFLDRLEPNSASYNMPLALKLTGRLDVRAMEQTLGEIIRRHEALRTTFAVENGEPVQIIHPVEMLPLMVIDLTGMEDDEREAEGERIDRGRGTAAFRPRAWPAAAGNACLRLAEEEHVLLFTMHHIVSDGWSMGVLVREVAALYEAYSAGRAVAAAPSLPIQYADYAVLAARVAAGRGA